MSVFKCDFVFSAEFDGDVGDRRSSAGPWLGGGSGRAGRTAAAGAAHLHHVQGEKQQSPSGASVKLSVFPGAGEPCCRCLTVV